MQLSTAGGRIIVSSDGVWDALSAETAFDCCRGMAPDAAASQIVKVCLQLVVFIFYLKRTLVRPTIYCLFECYVKSPWSLSQEAVGVKGLRDDTTCIVIDVHPPEKPNPPLPPPKKQGKGVFTSMFRKKSTESSQDNQQPEKEFCEPDVVEELYEEGSAMLSERFVESKSRGSAKFGSPFTIVGECGQCASLMPWGVFVKPFILL